MGGIPHESTCSICVSVRTKPPKPAQAKPGEQSLKNMAEVTSAWCALHQRKLLLHPYRFPDLDRKPSIFSTVCSQFKSVYQLVNEGKKNWPPPPGTRGDHDHLWQNGPSPDSKSWIFQPLIRLDELPKVNPATGDAVES